MNTRRTKIDIINDMLLSIQGKGGKIKPTHLMYKANLSHKSLNEYIDELITKQLIQEVNERGHNRYLVLTDKGFEFISQFRRMKEFQESFGL
jgi:predicted transcriptional regulator